MATPLRRSPRSPDKVIDNDSGANDTNTNESDEKESVTGTDTMESQSKMTSESASDREETGKSESPGKPPSSSGDDSGIKDDSNDVLIDKEATDDVEMEEADTQENDEVGKQTDSSPKDAVSSTESPSNDASKSPIEKKPPLELPPGALDRIKSNLQITDALEEDGISQKMIQIDRIVMDRAHQVVLPSVDDDSDDEHQDYQRIYQQEEHLVMMQHNFRHAVRGVDKKTANWLRSAMGLKNKHHFHANRDEEGESDEDEDETPKRKTTSRRLTRGMARTTRIRKREERNVRENQGLYALLDVIKDLEEDHGPFPLIESPSVSEEEEEEEPPRKRVKPSKPSRAKKEKEQAKRTLKVKPQPLIAIVPRKTSRKRRAVKDTDKTVLVTRIIANGKRILGPGEREVRKGSSRTTASKKRKAPPASTSFVAQPSAAMVDAVAPEWERNFVLDSFSPDDDSDEDDLYSGRLFGELASSLKNPGVVSLNLLDWNRRQQWTPEEANKERAQRIKFPPNVLDAGVQAALPPWETVNPIPRVPREPSTTMEPSCRRHSNATYAKWCNKLINFINGSGRMFAKAEFFYSDIDRAWYNLNEFQRDVAELGVPPSMKLTRAEWRIIRRNLPNRPRRFSRRFVREEFDRLNKYRRHVREVQSNPSTPRSPTMDHDIPARIRVGATVTAHNKKAHLLHRGIVLAHDEKRQAYLIQFERKELGFELCPDSDVASHGVPEILRAAPSISLDGTDYFSFSNHDKPGSLVYGTSYSQLSEYTPPKKASMIKDLIRCNTSSSLLAGIDASSKRQHNTTQTGKEAREKFVSKVAEREMLVKLMGFIDTALHRKDLLLQAMAECHSEFEAHSPTGHGESEDTADFRDHYSWLHSNLVVTNQSLEAALVHLQVMYGDRYGLTLIGSDDSQAKKRRIERMLAENPLPSGKHAIQDDDSVQEPDTPSLHWITTLLRESALTAKAMQLRILNEVVEESSSDQCRERFLEHRLTGAGQLLLAMNYGCGSYADIGAEDSTTALPPIKVDPRLFRMALSATLKNLAPRPLSVGNDETLKEFDSQRLDAYKELEDAVNLLESEMAAQRACERHAVSAEGEPS